MSTFHPNQDSNAGHGWPRSTNLSLRGLLKEAVFVGADDISVSRCVNRADRCQPGDVFVPRNSAAGDEHDRAEEALARGAVAIVSERLLPVSVPQCLVENTHEVYGQISQALVGFPSRRMLTIGIVGTYGKTTTSLYVAAMLKRLGGSVAYYTSLGASDSTECDRTATRAPAAGKLAKWMQRADEAEAPAGIIELTPAMIHSQAISGVEFDLVILTGMRPGQFRGNPNTCDYGKLLNLTCEKLKDHGVLLYNADDALAASWAEQSQLPAVSYGLDAAEHVRGKRLSRMGGEQQVLAMTGNMLMPLTLKTPGDHVMRAAMAAVATSWMFDLSVPEAIAGIEALESIPGRMQRLHQAVEVPVFIDAGESPDRLAVALHALRQHQFGPATIVLDLSVRVDSTFRQRLGEVLQKAAHKVVLSASDLAPEAARNLAMDVLGGLASPGQVEVIPDRAAAIRWAIKHTHRGCVLLSGCGVSSWCDRDGELHTDESVAKAAVSQRNQPQAVPQLNLYPPIEPTSFSAQ